MQVERMKVAPVTVAYADGDHHKLVVEFAVPGAPTETIDVKTDCSELRCLLKIQWKMR